MATSAILNKVDAQYAASTSETIGIVSKVIVRNRALKKERNITKLFEMFKAKVFTIQKMLGVPIICPCLDVRVSLGSKFSS